MENRTIRRLPSPETETRTPNVNANRTRRSGPTENASGATRGKRQARSRRRPKDSLAQNKPVKGQPMSESLREEKRKDAFRALVELQDEGLTTLQSRVQVAAQFSINVRELQNVEREGISKQWPPLQNGN
jgi:hypothetical protein